MSAISVFKTFSLFTFLKYFCKYMQISLLLLTFRAVFHYFKHRSLLLLKYSGRVLLQQWLVVSYWRVKLIGQCCLRAGPVSQLMLVVLGTPRSSVSHGHALAADADIGQTRNGLARALATTSLGMNNQTCPHAVTTVSDGQSVNMSQRPITSTQCQIILCERLTAVLNTHDVTDLINSDPPFLRYVVN